jgi:hypothetical protein
MEHFKPKDIPLNEAPPFPVYEFNNEMNPIERTKVLGYYMGKIVELLQGRQVAYKTRTNGKGY